MKNGSRIPAFNGKVSFRMNDTVLKIRDHVIRPYAVPSCLFACIRAGDKPTFKQIERSGLAYMRQLIELIRRYCKRLAQIYKSEESIGGLPKLSDERFITMSGNYEAEQHSLKVETEALEAELAREEQKKTDLRLLIKTVREQADVKQLTPCL